MTGEKRERKCGLQQCAWAIVKRREDGSGDAGGFGCVAIGAKRGRCGGGEGSGHGRDGGVDGSVRRNLSANAGGELRTQVFTQVCPRVRPRVRAQVLIRNARRAQRQRAHAVDGRGSVGIGKQRNRADEPLRIVARLRGQRFRKLRGACGVGQRKGRERALSRIGKWRVVTVGGWIERAQKARVGVLRVDGMRVLRLLMRLLMRLLGFWCRDQLPRESSRELDGHAHGCVWRDLHEFDRATAAGDHFGRAAGR